MLALGGNPRGAAEALTIPAAALAVSLILFGIFVALAGADPLSVYQTIYLGAFGGWFSWQNTLQRGAPMMLTALCTALPASLGLIVIGGEGALIIGDNSHESDSLSRFASETGRCFVFFRETPKNHWYPGAGIGFAFERGLLARVPNP